MNQLFGTIAVCNRCMCMLCWQLVSDREGSKISRTFNWFIMNRHNFCAEAIFSSQTYCPMSQSSVELLCLNCKHIFNHWKATFFLLRSLQMTLIFKSIHMRKFTWLNMVWLCMYHHTQFVFEKNSTAQKMNWNKKKKWLNFSTFLVWNEPTKRRIIRNSVYLIRQVFFLLMKFIYTIIGFLRWAIALSLI